MRSRHLLAVGLIVGLVGVAGCGGDDDSGDGGDQAAPPPPPAATTPPPPPGPTGETGATGPTGETGAGDEGRELFANTCGTCHTLEAAGTDGQVGPNLDELQPDEQQVLDAIANGPGVMPANLFEGADADAVAAFVSQNAGQ